MQLLIEASGKASKRLKALEKRLGGSTELMQEIAALVIEKNKDTFKRVKLAPATIEYKETWGLSQEPLVESGEMKEELTSEKGIKLLTPTELRFGSSSQAKGEGRGREITTAKATLSQKGTRHQRKRKVLRVTPTSRAAIAELVLHHVTDD
jgi:phage gpG-like protein